MNNERMEHFKNLLTPTISKSNKCREKLEILIKELDNIELISHLSLMKSMMPQPFCENFDEMSMELKIFKDEPTLHFLLGLALKNEDYSGRTPNGDDIKQTIESVNNYFIYYSNQLILQSSVRNQVAGEDDIVLSSRLQKIIKQMNPNIYPFQMEEFIKKLYCKLDEYFLKTLGFTSFTALLFSKRIINRYAKLIKKRFEEIEDSKEKVRHELKDEIKGAKIREQFKRKKDSINDEEIIRIYENSLMFTFTQEIFVFKVNEFCREEGIKDIKKFQNYLKTFSCKFGDGNKNFDCPLDENIIVYKPIINIDSNNYFSPNFHDLTNNLPVIFEKLLEPEKQKQSKLWQSYQDLKSQFTEDRVYEYFSRIFPKEDIYRNLKYKYNGEECELDLLILVDNKIFLCESKSGLFTEPAQRGAIQRLKIDLKKLIEHAFKQGNRARKYIKSSKNQIFYNNGQQIVLNINSDSCVFYIINVTLEVLMMLATGLKKLQSMGLFEENEYPWSVNLFELDIITDIISSPSIFIHYLNSRLKAQDEDVFVGLDELSFLGYYLNVGNFFTPLTNEGGKFDFVQLESDWLIDFDKHYLLGEEKPRLEIEPFFIDIIVLLEKDSSYGYTDTAMALLDIPHSERNKIFEQFKVLINKSLKDKKEHDFSIYLNDTLNTGYTFMTHYKNSLKKKLSGYCILKKYQTKAEQWVGIALAIKGRNWYISDIYYEKGPWEYNDELDKLVKKNLE